MRIDQILPRRLLILHGRFNKHPGACSFVKLGLICVSPVASQSSMIGRMGLTPVSSSLEWFGAAIVSVAGAIGKYSHAANEISFIWDGHWWLLLLRLLNTGA